MANTYTPDLDGYNANTPRYNSLINKIYDWSNRDLQALPPQVVRDSVRYAVDTAYRTLRIPPLENTVVYTNFPGTYTYTPDGTTTPLNVAIADQSALTSAQEANPGGTYVGPLNNASIGEGSIYQSVTGLAIPPDLIEFIHIRGRDENGLTTRVFNEKTDIRSFWDICNNHYNQTAFWSRQGDRVVLTPSFGNVARGFYGGGAGPEVALELYYYRRQSALDAQFTVNAANFNSQSEGGQLMTQVATPENIDGFLSITGNGRLYFEEYEQITVDNYLMNTTPPLVTAVPADSVGIDGSLWFRPADVDWTVVADNWNNFGMDNNDRISWVPPGGVFTGTLWFDPSPETDDLQVPASNNQVFTNEVVLGGNSGITRVARIRQGSEVELTLGTDYILELRDDGRVNVIFSGTVSTSDIYLVSYDSRPANPYFQTAFANNSTGMRTAFHFIGNLNLDEVNNPTTPFTTTGVSDMRTDEFSQQVFFIGMDDIPNQHPQPGTNTAYAVPTVMDMIDATVPFYFTGTSVPNWFKDENEKIVLYGALAQCFAYLQEDDQSGKYLQLMQKEIDDLNNEDRVRDSSGGNVQVQYTARGLI